MPKTILVLAANPKDTPSLRLEQEVREIDNGLQRAQNRDEFILRQQLAARPKDVRRAMLNFKPNIVHFCGHGEGEEGLVFEDETGHKKLVSTEALEGFFKLFADKGVECVILNACYSEIQAGAIAQHIDYVIGMRRGIGDTAAIKFAVAFYDALGAGESIEFAYKLACNAIQWAGISECLTSMLELKTRITKQSVETPIPVTKIGLLEDSKVAEHKLQAIIGHSPWIQVDDLIRFNDLIIPCIMCEGDGSYVFEREGIICHFTDTDTEYPPDVKDLIKKVRFREHERRQRGETYAWEDGPPLFGLKKWFPTRAGSSEKPVLNLIFKPTSYYEFLGTNMILDEKCIAKPDGRLISLREKYVPNIDWERPASMLSNLLGVVMSAITKDGYWIAVERSEEVRWVPNTFQTSIGEGANLITDRDNAERPDIFKTVIRGAIEELGIEICEKNIGFLGLICDINFYQYDMIGLIRLEAESREVMIHRSLGTKDGRFESKQLFLVQYNPQSIAEFLATHQPWWPRAVVSILYSLVHDFGFDTVTKVMHSNGLARLEYRYH